MTLSDLLHLADSCYPENLILEHWKHPDHCNDTLALFIVRELRDVYDKDASDKSQLEVAFKAVQRAEIELASVRKGLENAYRKAPKVVVKKETKVIPFNKNVVKH